MSPSMLPPGFDSVMHPPQAWQISGNKKRKKKFHTSTQSRILLESENTITVSLVFFGTLTAS